MENAMNARAATTRARIIMQTILTLVRSVPAINSKLLRSSRRGHGASANSILPDSHQFPLKSSPQILPSANASNCAPENSNRGIHPGPKFISINGRMTCSVITESASSRRTA